MGLLTELRDDPAPGRLVVGLQPLDLLPLHPQLVEQPRVPLLLALGPGVAGGEVDRAVRQRVGVGEHRPLVLRQPRLVPLVPELRVGAHERRDHFVNVLSDPLLINAHYLYFYLTRIFLSGLEILNSQDISSCQPCIRISF